MTDQTEKAVVLTAEMARAHLAYVKELQIALWSRVGNLPTVPLLVAAHDAIEAIASGRAVISEAGHDPAAFRVNMLRLCPQLSHSDIDLLIAQARVGSSAVSEACQHCNGRPPPPPNPPAPGGGRWPTSAEAVSLVERTMRDSQQAGDHRHITAQKVVAALATRSPP